MLCVSSTLSLPQCSSVSRKEMNISFVHSAAIKINCCGFCGVTNKVNDTSWNEEEQYFNSTISVADKGMLLMLLRS